MGTRLEIEKDVEREILRESRGRLDQERRSGQMRLAKILSGAGENRGTGHEQRRERKG